MTKEIEFYSISLAVDTQSSLRIYARKRIGKLANKVLICKESMFPHKKIEEEGKAIIHNQSEKHILVSAWCYLENKDETIKSCIDTLNERIEHIKRNLTLMWENSRDIPEVIEEDRTKEKD
jgi:hypothetical protein